MERLAHCLPDGSMTIQAGALEYTIDAPGDPDYGKPTSIEPVITADGGAAVNEDRSKNAAVIPPTFGSPSAYTPNTGTYLTPNLAPGSMAATGCRHQRGICGDCHTWDSRHQFALLWQLFVLRHCRLYRGDERSLLFRWVSRNTEDPCP